MRHFFVILNKIMNRNETEEYYEKKSIKRHENLKYDAIAIMGTSIVVIALHIFGIL